MTNSFKDIPPEFFSESAVATFIVTPDHGIVFWNRACETLTGLAAEEVLFTDDHWKPFYPERRPCLADIVIDGNYEYLPKLYTKYGTSKLSEEGIRAEGWFESLGGRQRYIIFDAVPVYNDSGKLVAAIETLHDITDLKAEDTERERLIKEFQELLIGSHSLAGFIPICSSCKSIRNKEGSWIDLVEYFRDSGGAQFTHSLCPGCTRNLYPEFFD